MKIICVYQKKNKKNRLLTFNIQNIMIQQFSYKNNLIFGDDNYHVLNCLQDIGLFIPSVGSSFNIPSGYKIVSPYLWRYNFSSANTTNFWSSSSEYGANGSSIPSGINTSTSYTVGNSLISEAYISTTNTTNIALTSIRLSSYNNWYFNTIPSFPSNALYRAILIRFSDNRTFDFPTNFYSLDENNNIIWNTEHYLFSIYKNKEVTIVEI